MPVSDPLIPLIGALWLAISTVITTTRAINERRDVIMSGMLGSTQLTEEHRTMILNRDWRPMVRGAWFMCSVLFVLLILTPWIVAASYYYKALFSVAALVPAYGAGSWFVHARHERSIMEAKLGIPPKTKGRRWPFNGAR